LIKSMWSVIYHKPVIQGVAIIRYVNTKFISTVKNN
jgi:hypothetical protein